MTPRPIRWFSIIVALLAVVAAACTGRAEVVAVANSSWDPITANPTQAEWQEMHDNYGRLIVYSPYWDSRLQHFDDVLVYFDAYAVYVSSDVEDQHPEWVMRQANGSPAYIDWGCTGGCPQYAGDLANPDFVAHQISRIQELVDKGYPGIKLDDVNMLARWSDRWGHNLTPIDSRTGQPITLDAWRGYMADFVETVRATFPDLEIMHNVIWYSDSPGFSDPNIDRQIAAADYLMLERGATDAGLVRGSGTYGIQTFFDYVDRAHALGTNVLLLDQSDGEANQQFNLAGTLLVNDGNDLVGSNRFAHMAPDNLWDGFATDLGLAEGERYVVDGFIVREFSGGMVVLREPTRGQRTFTLPETMIDLDGDAVDRVTLTGGEAAILRLP